MIDAPFVIGSSPPIYTKLMFDWAYSGNCTMGCEAGQGPFGYGKHFYNHNKAWYGRKAQALIDIGIVGRIVICGGGFGFLSAELLSYECVRSADVLDNSPWIATHFAEESPVPGVAFHKANFVSKPKILDGYDWIVTESLMESIPNPRFLDKFDDNVIHIVQENAVDPFISKSLDEWKLVKKDHIWLSVR